MKESLLLVFANKQDLKDGVFRNRSYNAVQGWRIIQQWTLKKSQMLWSSPRWKTRSGTLYQVVQQQEKVS